MAAGGVMSKGSPGRRSNPYRGLSRLRDPPEPEQYREPVPVWPDLSLEDAERMEWLNRMLRCNCGRMLRSLKADKTGVCQRCRRRGHVP